jgi:HSP20 family protein
LDLHEDREKNIVTAIFEFPGFSKDEVQLDFQNGKLTVSAETKKSEDAQNGRTSRERFHGKFSRTIQLPRGVKVCCSSLNMLLNDGRLTSIIAQNQQIKATMENGLLTVTFPKTVPELAPKKIVISDA